MKVYRVTVSKEVWILAENDQDAEREAKFCADDDMASWDAFAVEVKSANQIPNDVKKSNIWGTQNDISVMEAIQRMSAKTIPG